MSKQDQRLSQRYRDLIAWPKGMRLAKSIYRLPARFPAEEKYGLVSQMRRAAVSMPSHLAEGQARRTTGEFLQFISHAEGSVAELGTRLTLAVELSSGFASDGAEADGLIPQLRKMLDALRRSVANS